MSLSARKIRSAVCLCDEALAHFMRTVPSRCRAARVSRGMAALEAKLRARHRCAAQVLGNQLKDMCRMHNPVSRHKRIDHGMGAVEMDTGFGSVVVPQVRAGPSHPQGLCRVVAPNDCLHRSPVHYGCTWEAPVCPT